jgi:formylglycine-generating enzyme required for sulfatase activity
MKKLAMMVAMMCFFAMTAKSQNQGKPNLYSASVNGVTFIMVEVKGGSYDMGHDVTSELYFSTDAPAHQVEVADFIIGETEVSQALWQAVMGSNPSRFTGDDQNPVEQINWGQCQRFIDRLNELTNLSFRLPTEAEWEYAARGGRFSKGTLYAGSDECDEVAWIQRDGRFTHPVKTKKANELGLYDMTGNVWEWTSTGFSRYGTEPKLQPTDGGYLFVYRGGGYINNERQAIVYHRSYGQLTDSNPYIGLRLAMDHPQKH